MPYERELETALEAARRAGEMLVGEYERFQKIADAPADITTHADRQAQEIVLKHLRATFPTDAFCAEEETETLAGAATSGPRLWIIDPIDGTRGFARKNGEFSVMVAFADQGRIGVGLVLEPARARLTYAVRGGGCWRRDRGSEPQRCQVTRTARMADATVTQSHSRNPAEPSREIRALAPRRVLESYSAGIKLALVARGEADLYLNTYEGFHDWDIAAGHILVDEAGGRVSGLAGQELRYGLPGAWQRHGLLGSNGLVHEEAVARLKEIK
jgi:3'(2'), 5'-bisphosphate nucleotidase